VLKKLSIILLLICFSLQSAFALYGARPMGMGQAFTAVANDANASRWNPAGLALNPEVVINSSTMANNRNRWVGDNLLNLKMCYETEMDPFSWIAGVGLASLFAYEGARYLGDKGILKKGWGRSGTKTERGQALITEGTGEAVSLKAKLNSTANVVLKDTDQAVRSTAREAADRARWYYLTPWATPWYNNRNHSQPRDKRGNPTKTKAQFALGLSWLNDYNPPSDENANWYTITVASGFEKRVAVGGNINIYNMEKISSGIRGIGGDLDIGVIAKPVEYLSFGLVSQGILTTDITWQNGSTSRYEMITNIGLAIEPVPALTLAADMHNVLHQNNSQPTYHYGVEAALMPGLIARAGLSDGSKTAGLSLIIGRLTIDYAYLGGTYNRTQMIGGSWSL